MALEHDRAVFICGFISGVSSGLVSYTDVDEGTANQMADQLTQKLIEEDEGTIDLMLAALQGAKAKE